MHRDVQQEITDTIIRQIEAGAGKWQMPWHAQPGEFSGALPVNQDGRHYRGLNVVLLWAAAIDKGYAAPVWGTFKAWKGKGGIVRKGEKATLVFFWSKIIDKKHKRENPQGDDKFIWFTTAYNVFNKAQIDGLPEEAAPTIAPELPENQRIANAEAFFTNIGATVKHGGNRAYYTMGGDYIQLPVFEAFKSAEDYYSTSGHEHIHWT